MPVIDSSAAPVFTYDMPDFEKRPGVPHLIVRGLASPRRGSTQTSVWRMTISPRIPARMGVVDHEEIFTLLSGAADVLLGGEPHQLKEGDCMIVPPDTEFGIANPYDEPVEFLVVLPVGGRARVPGMEPFTPPWAQ